MERQGAVTRALRHHSLKCDSASVSICLVMGLHAGPDIPHISRRQTTSAPVRHQQSPRHPTRVSVVLLCHSLCRDSHHPLKWSSARAHTHTSTRLPRDSRDTMTSIFPHSCEDDCYHQMLPTPHSVSRPPAVEGWVPYHYPLGVTVGSGLASDGSITPGNRGWILFAVFQIHLPLWQSHAG